MGEAKRRGTFEQRKAEGVIKRAEAEERRKQIQAERRDRVFKKKPQIAMLMAALDSISVPEPFIDVEAEWKP